MNLRIRRRLLYIPSRCTMMGGGRSGGGGGGLDLWGGGVELGARSRG